MQVNKLGGVTKGWDDKFEFGVVLVILPSDLSKETVIIGSCAGQGVVC